MIPSNVLTIAARVVRQLVRDRRTMVLILVVPVVIMTLVRYSAPEGRAMLWTVPTRRCWQPWGYSRAS